ncbi:MAG: hypothetical protein JSV97_00325 [candidate division WOR-3 bacterium]|nr:MAG: hypothetical protein JSV97_00325 [candidate division WOR-3 bacterium]
MKKFLVLLLLICFCFASDFIPFDKIEHLAYQLVNQQFEYHSLIETITYYGFDEQPNAYAMVYQSKENEPLTIVMGARYTTTPVGEISMTIPRCKSVYNKILQKARTVARTEPVFDRVYYFGPGEEYCSFKAEERDILINTCTFRVIDKSALFEHIPEPHQELEVLTRQKWDNYFNTQNFSTLQDTGYISNVPFIDWVYGCSPTASAMIFWYWDEFAPSPGYGRLVDYSYTHWDNPENEWNFCANVNRELALAMPTYDTVINGATAVDSIAPGQLRVANIINGYSCGSSTSPQGHSGNQYMFSWIKSEIDAGRPFHWVVIQYYSPAHGERVNHSVTGIGYHISPPDTFVRVHDTWNYDEPLWPLWTYYGGVYSWDYVITFVPGGAITDNIFLDWPIGGTMYGPTNIFANIKYTLRWQSVGSTIDHVKIWYSTGRQGSGYDSLQWTLIDNNAPNTGTYVWTCPAIDDTIRINISGLNASNQRLAADGSWGWSMVCEELSHSAGVDLVGHLPTDVGYTHDIQTQGTYAFIADGPNGLVVADIADSSLPVAAGHLPLPGRAYSLALNASYAYIGDQEDTLRVISISDPANPSQLGMFPLNDQALDVCAVGNLVYIAARTQGLVIVDVTDPTLPDIEGEYDTPGFSYDVFVDGNYAYVADAIQGVRIIDVSTPGSPSETGFYDTNGICYGVTKSGNYVYAADGAQGIKIFDASSPDTLILLNSLDTPGTATKVRVWNNTLFVADGTYGGVRVIDVTNPNSPSELGYIESRGAAGNLWLPGGPRVYLADGGNGLLLITQELIGIAEDEADAVEYAVSIVPSHSVTHRATTFNIYSNRATRVDMKLFDAMGRLVETIYSDFMNIGNNKIHWQPQDIPAGVYFVHSQVGNSRDIHKLVLVK